MEMYFKIQNVTACTFQLCGLFRTKLQKECPIIRKRDSSVSQNANCHTALQHYPKVTATEISIRSDSNGIQMNSWIINQWEKNIE